MVLFLGYPKKLSTNCKTGSQRMSKMYASVFDDYKTNILVLET